jgi:predicted transcriptional regulator
MHRSVTRWPPEPSTCACPRRFTTRLKSWPRRPEEFPKATARTKSFVAIAALTNYVPSESWQILDIHEGIKEADAGEFATDRQVKAVFTKHST